MKPNYSILLAVVIVGVVVYFSWQGQQGGSGPDRERETIKQEQERKAAILKDFPQNLILDGNAKQTYFDVQDTREGQLWRQGYESQLQAADLAKRYREYLSGGEWIKLLDTTTPQGEVVMNFLKDQSRLGITIVADGAGSKLNLDYYKRLAIFDQGKSIGNPIYAPEQ